MKRLLLICFMALLPMAGSTWAATGQLVIDGYLDPAQYVQISSVASATGLGTIPNGARIALIQAEGADVRWRDDGTNPTSAVGMLLEDGQTLVYNSNLAAIKFIDVTTGAKLNVSFYK